MCNCFGFVSYDAPTRISRIVERVLCSVRCRKDVLLPNCHPVHTHMHGQRGTHSKLCAASDRLRCTRAVGACAFHCNIDSNVRCASHRMTYYTCRTPTMSSHCTDTNVSCQRNKPAISMRKRRREQFHLSNKSMDAFFLAANPVHPVYFSKAN